MNQKSQIILLQLVKALQSSKWTSDNEWQLSLKVDGYVPLVRTVIVEGNLDGDKWKDQIYVMIRLKVSTEDEITFFPEFSIYAQIAVGSIPSKDIDYKMAGNEAFTEKDLKDNKKFNSASHEINRLVDSYINEVYQDYVDVNEDLVKFYKQRSSQPEPPQI